ncbi:UbiA family prenyltransferase [Halovivax sp.]|uniref:UbiA family prenyltransferase n=1 Tax=Halovivax sp. TaxID=1935978 RepID=UPI0025BD71CF|nr:UbiA family prenyltransferase [Halovivax sp.]
MPIARHGTGILAATRAYLSQVHPVFMLPPLAASIFGGILTGTVAPVEAGAHVVAIFAAVYTAHVQDGYVDFHVRGEDDDHPLTVTGCRLGLVGSTVLFALACTVVFMRVDAVAVALTLPTWLIAYFHAPRLDVHPIGATAGYPVGIGLAILGGYYVQAGSIGTLALAFAAVFVVLLSGIKVIDDAQDYDYDRSIRKRTVAVVLGPKRAHDVAFGLLAVALVGVIGFAVYGAFPPGSVLAVVAFGAVAVVARRAPPTLATMLLIRGSYVFLAVLVAAVWFEPLATL